jgi:hypothetical protein
VPCDWQRRVELRTKLQLDRYGTASDLSDDQRAPAARHEVVYSSGGFTTTVTTVRLDSDDER